VLIVMSHLTLIVIFNLDGLVSKVQCMVRKAVAMIMSPVNLMISMVTIAMVCRTWTSRDDHSMSL
jgi:hypothetical protein